MEWTEGFSCRRLTALKAGLFPVGFALPICAGEDGFFGANLRGCGAKKVIDMSIVVDHVAPASLIDYWRTRVGRGVGSAQIHRFINGWSTGRLLLWNAFKSCVSLVTFATVISPMITVYRLTRLSDRGAADLPAFAYARTFEYLAFHVGEWKGTFQPLSSDRVAH
jgi:hypothetical protein